MMAEKSFHNINLMAARRTGLYVKLVIALFAVIGVYTTVYHNSAWTYSPSLASSLFTLYNDAERQARYIAAKKSADVLDRKYISRVISKYNDPHSSHRSSLGSGAAADFDSSSYTATIVMGRRKSEADKAGWVHNQLKNIQQQYIYIVDDNSNPTIPHLEENHGRESAVYLNYITQHYHNLSDITFFWHNDEVVWHNNLLLGWNSIETINRMDRENIMRSGYVPSRCDHWPGCPSWIRYNPSKAEHSLDPHRLEDKFDSGLFARLFNATEDEIPAYFSQTCCSQFAVSRATIHSRPLEVYQSLLDWVVETKDDLQSGMILEYLWQYIFLRRGVMCPAMQDCYCKTYNFCIEDNFEIEQLNMWNNLRTRREEVKWQVKFMEEARESRQQLAESKGAKGDEVLAIEEMFEGELNKLEDELDHLVNRTWSMREGILKRWKLPTPPVGW